MFDKLLKNDAVKKMFMKQFEGIAKDQNLKAIVINLNDDGTLGKVDTYTESITVMKKDDFDNLLKTL